MKKRIFALVLCVFMLVPLFSSCSHKVVESTVQIYLTHQVYDFDPLHAYTNESQLKLSTLLFAGLYKIGDDGKVVPDLVEKATYENDSEKKEYTITLTLKDTYWNDGSAVSSDNVVYTFKRVLKTKYSNDAAAMLYKIKNARAVKEGSESIDDLCVYAPGTKVVEIQFEEPITDMDFEDFKLCLTSPALYPLRENVVEGKDDWAKKPATMLFSGPFFIRRVSYENGKRQLLLERNSYYFRNREKDAEDKYVTPYRILIDYDITAEEQMALYDEGQVLFAGEIPLSLREKYESSVEMSDTMSTHTYYFNQNSIIYTKNYIYNFREYYNNQKLIYDKSQAVWDSDEAKKVAAHPTGAIFPSDFPKFPEDFSSESVKEFNAQVKTYNDEIKKWLKKCAGLTVYTDAAPQPFDNLLEDANAKKLFAITEVRQALSLAIDRQAISDMVVFASPATGFVPSPVFNGLNKKSGSFREQGGSLISTTANLAAANEKLAASGINPSDYIFTISYRECDEVHAAIVNMVAETWRGLGFTIEIEPIGVMVNDEKDGTGSVPEDIRDDLYDEAIAAGEFDVIALDYVVKCPDAFSALAPFAHDYTGNATIVGALSVDDPHISGYDSEAYNDLITKAFNADDVTSRTNYLHEAEKMLIDDAAVMPVLFGKSAALVNNDIKGLEKTYFGFYNFSKLEYKNQEAYDSKYFAETVVTTGSSDSEEPVATDAPENS